MTDSSEMTAEMKESIRDLTAAGFNRAEIMKRTGCTERELNAALVPDQTKKERLDKKVIEQETEDMASKKYIKAKEKAEMIRLKTECGLTVKEVADTTGRSMASVGRIVSGHKAGQKSGQAAKPRRINEAERVEQCPVDHESEVLAAPEIIISKRSRVCIVLNGTEDAALEIIIPEGAVLRVRSEDE